MRIIAVALLDEAIEHRRDAERSSTAPCLRYLHLPRRLQLAAAVKKLASNRRPVLFQVGPSASKLMLSIPAAPLLALTCANACLGWHARPMPPVYGQGTARILLSMAAALLHGSRDGPSPLSWLRDADLPR